MGELTTTCYMMYKAMETGLSAVASPKRDFALGEIIKIGEKDFYVAPNDRHNLLRPETVDFDAKSGTFISTVVLFTE